MAEDSFETAEAFVKAANKFRLQHNKQWFCFVGTIAGKSVRMKTYSHSYLQQFEIDGLNDIPPIDTSVGAWKDFMLKRFSESET